jgi:hypothetical protein
VASSASRTGERNPRATQDPARSSATCHTATVSPIAPPSTAVDRYPPRASRPRHVGRSASGPSASLATPISASLTPSISPSAPAPACRVLVRKLGNAAVVIS